MLTAIRDRLAVFAAALREGHSPTEAGARVGLSPAAALALARSPAFRGFMSVPLAEP